jgi:DNA replication protein DnaC
MHDIKKQGHIVHEDLTEEYWSTDDYDARPICSQCGERLTELQAPDPEDGTYSCNWYKWMCNNELCREEREKYVRQRIETRKAEKADAPEMTKAELAKYNIGVKYKASQLSHFTDEVADFCREFVQNNSPGLLLYGDTGTGKTYLTIAILRQFIRSGCRKVYFDNVPGILTKINDTMSEKQGLSYGKMIDRYSQYYDVLGIDDYGTQKQTEASDATVFGIINTRYNDSKKTIFTTNFKPDYILNHIDKRLGSRLMEYDSLLLGGKDKRQKFGGRVLHVSN